MEASLSELELAFLRGVYQRRGIVGTDLTSAVTVLSPDFTTHGWVSAFYSVAFCLLKHLEAKGVLEFVDGQDERVCEHGWHDGLWRLTSEGLKHAS